MQNYRKTQISAMSFTQLLTVVATVVSLSRHGRSICILIFRGNHIPHFDDGPYEYGAKLDATLDASDAKASFFINGYNWGCIYDYADVLRERFAKGHLIASHTWSHPHLNGGTYQQISHQLELVEKAMVQILGVKPLYMRPPYGEFNDVVLQVLHDRGYKGLIMWSKDSGDTQTPTPSSSQIIQNYQSYPEKSIVLNHEVKDFTVNEVMPRVIPALKQKGFSLQTIPECLGLSSNPKDWYVSVQQPGARDASWTCSVFQSQEGMGFTRLLTLVVTVASLLRFDQVIAAHTNSSLRVRQNTAVPVYNTCTVPRSFALTFDDGLYGYSEKLDGHLNRANAKGSFFINGQNWGCIYDSADQLLARFNQGHFIGSHTWSHVHLNQGTYDQIDRQLELLETAMIKILGVKPLHETSLCYKFYETEVTKDWSCGSQDSGDTHIPAPSSSPVIRSYRSYPEKNHCIESRSQGFHCRGGHTAVIPILQRKGFSLQTVPECLGLSSDPADWYVRVQEAGTRDDSWTCEGTPLPGNYIVLQALFPRSAIKALVHRFQSQEGMGFTRLLTLVVTVASLVSPGSSGSHDPSPTTTLLCAVSTRILMRIPPLVNKLRFDQVTGAHTNDIRTLRARQDTAVPVYDTCTVPGSFALTFDDGPYGFSTRLDSTLNAANAKGSFFINGQNWGCIYDYADVLLERFNNGHFIASHTWSHVHMNQGTYEQLSHQLELVEQAMIRILGVKPLYMRPPYGEYNDVVLQVLRDRGYKGLIMWNQDSGDTFTPTPSSAQIIDSYRSFPEKTISLNHEIKDFTVDQVIPAVIPILQQKGFSLQTVPECLGLSSDPADWYVRVQEPGTRDDSWTCEATPLPGNFE
ncbi:hypothetical protein PSHT_05127 [Puccinia striiformis]|uniref:NodB homology domain-containing protein n=1 Tax=Puccinia striiformis TaxID=27350 RepID=A0A2S4WB81_9BASI|nr:hypothetical protein PSHT_05127 [Puccinia striiformis]